MKAVSNTAKTALPRKRLRRPAEETRSEILATAEKLFSMRGFSTVTIADIAAEMSMSPANVFKHFHSKVALVDAIVLRQITSLQNDLDAMDTSLPPYERLHQMALSLMRKHVVTLEETPYLFEMIVMMAKQELDCGEQYLKVLNDHVGKIVESGVDLGIYHADDIEETADTINHALISVIHPVLIAGEQSDILATRCTKLVNMMDAALRNTLAK
ncbi:TetR/AcrR family transcriptional regulator [Agrobacterium sp.]|uniref:TetR/AcrR family transcriptional regulator n=1 Tax=Agrobacterium sp. TaxID=361 RepID=UPI0028AD369C|nr:TetR/AcrR family transcriptional regulator [Agrobacterium sp.]